MNILVRNIMLRSITILGIGLVLVKYADEAPEWLVETIGGLLILLGLITLGTWIFQKTISTLFKFLLPVISVATILLGTILVVFPTEFIKAFMYAVATLLILIGILQFSERLNMARNSIKVSTISFLVPITSVSIGLFVIAYYRAVSNLPFIIMGSTCILYALLEFASSIQIYSFNKKNKQFVTTAVNEEKENEEGKENSIEQSLIENKQETDK